jgi:iron complex outermembrane recepter protein
MRTAGPALRVFRIPSTPVDPSFRLTPMPQVWPALTQDGGGDYEVDSIAWFGCVDYNIRGTWILTGGLRYTSKDKSAEIASLIRNVKKPCKVTEGTCPFDFADDDSWKAWAYKLVTTSSVSDQARIYGYWTRSQRSGGYNLRNTAGDTVNNPLYPSTRRLSTV